MVNIYDANVAAEEKRPKPLKSIMNLTTQIDDIQFNSDGQLLAFLSRRKRDALKLFFRELYGDSAQLAYRQDANSLRLLRRLQSKQRHVGLWEWKRKVPLVSLKPL